MLAIVRHRQMQMQIIINFIIIITIINTNIIIIIIIIIIGFIRENISFPTIIACTQSKVTLKWYMYNQLVDLSKSIYSVLLV